MLVIDASAATDLLLGRPAASAVEREIVAHEFDLHSPHLLDIEVLSALRRLVRTGRTSATRADEAITDLLDLPVERYAHEVLAPRIWELRDNVSAYDAAYLALAEVVAAPLLTTDARLATAARAHTALEVLDPG
jgi:predicted nucleic acid-binding protein